MKQSNYCMNIDKKTIIEQEIGRRIELHKDDEQLVKILEVTREAYITIFCSDQKQEDVPSE